MARIQVLPLTPRMIGTVTATPFVIIIDQVGQAGGPSGSTSLDAVLLDIGEQVGAEAVIVYDGDLTVSPFDPVLQEVARAAVEAALTPDGPHAVLAPSRD